MQKAFTIVSEQIKFLAEHSGLGIDENTIRKILKFKMLRFEEVQEYFNEHCPKPTGAGPSLDKEHEVDNFFEIMTWNRKRWYLKDTYHYYEGNTIRPQRKLIRYLNIALSLQGLINLDTNPQVVQDLKELNINLANPQSVQLGGQLIRKSFPYVLNQFLEYESKATDLSNYISLPSINEEWIACFNDDERFGSESLGSTELTAEQFLQNIKETLKTWEQDTPFNK